MSEENYKYTSEKIEENETRHNSRIEIMKQIAESNKAGLEDKTSKFNISLIPKLLINDHTKGTKVLSEIISELKVCSEFYISVAFITMSGVTTLLPILQELENKNIPGKIITTDYLTFSEPKALKKLLSFSNISFRVYTKENFHTKGYIFKHRDYYKIIVGSSNLTQNALTKNKEWNMRVSSLNDGLLIDNVIGEFHELWKESEPLTWEWITTYEDIYKRQRKNARQTKVPNIEQYKLRPNKIQVKAINNLQALRHEGKDKALVISATGTGKTYLSAFELNQFNPNKALFIVHRERIARQALKSFSRVFGDTKSLGLLIGQTREIDRDIIFSTVQTLYKDETLQSFKQDEFDYIIIDEVHKAGAPTYQKIVSYFKPKFLLGLTATPERCDDFDIFKMFDYNIAYEIRLKQALEEDILCPFHYFGISDLEVKGVTLKDDADFTLLTSDERVKHIIDKIEFYGYSGDRVKGLIFCSRTDEAKELSELFNKRGYRTVALSGADGPEVRDEMIERLEQVDNNDKALDYIFTVDIFNEGVDIPAVNQVVMLRPTQSSIVFVQQLGRGLRKSSEKEYVVIIDFVGSYKNNFLIPIALSGDRSYNKDTLRRYVAEGSRVIPGCSTVNFDEITKERIFAAIDSTNFTDIRLIKEKYTALKQKLGHIPRLIDFDTYDSINPIRIFDSSAASYYGFLKKYEPEYKVTLNEIEEKFVEFISKKLAPGKRPHELVLLKLILEECNKDLITELHSRLKKEYDISLKITAEVNVINVMTNEFATGTGKDTYSSCIFIEDKNNQWQVSDIFKGCLANEDFKKMITELVEFGLHRYEQTYSMHYQDTSFVLNEKYTYEDVCRLLEWPKNEVATNIGGYKYNKETNTLPVFINYTKDEDIADTIKYEDKFINESEIIAISKSNRRITSSDITTIYSAEENKTSIFLFMRKSNKGDKEAKEFYFLGRIRTTGEPLEVMMPNTNKPVVEIKYKLDNAVAEDVYQYLTVG